MRCVASIRDRCLAEMRASFVEVAAVLETIPAGRLTEVGVTDEWSARDLVAHQAVYERYVAALLFGELTGQRPTTHHLYGRDDTPTAADGVDEDAGNAWVVAHARTLPVEAVLSEFRWAHERLIEAVERCEEGDFGSADRFPSFEGRSLEDSLPGQCWNYHRQHLPQLEAFARYVTSTDAK